MFNIDDEVWFLDRWTQQRYHATVVGVVPDDVMRYDVAVTGDPDPWPVSEFELSPYSWSEV